ncbi:hypothetical protein KSS87_012626 [Heliosperma pusillum]|nr:hypothetical protein KSS87_012626 [Heliosperma pusillum]
MMAVMRRLIRSPTSNPSLVISTIRKFSSLTSETTLHTPPSILSNTQLQETQAKGRDVHWVFLGCPGVGKGTYATRLSKLLTVPHIATGDLVRNQLSSAAPLASPLLELGSFLVHPDLFSMGFPRTLRQAYGYPNRLREILEGVIDIDLVINLKLQEEALIAKCLGRRICSECGGNYNVACIDIKGDNETPGMYMAPLPPPPECASKLITRPDDKEEVVKERLRIYNEMSRPVEEFYRKRGKLLQFDLPGGIPESWPKLLQVLNLDGNEDGHSAAA